MAEQESLSPEAQIAELERQLQAKRAELGADASAPYERAEVRDVVSAQIQEAAPEYQPAPAAAPDAETPSWSDPALAGPVEQLVQVALGQTIAAATAKALATGNAALIDALHDALTDHFFPQLVARKKIDPAP